MNVKNLVLGIGIIIVFGLALWQGIAAFAPFPQHDRFCDYSKPTNEIYNVSACQEAGGKWYEDAYPRPAIDNKTVTGYCDMYYGCNQEYEEAQRSHSWTVFLVSLIVAIITLILGFLILKVEPVGSALIGSAIWAIFWGSVVNWRNFGSAWRFILLFIALVLLILIALKINKGFGNKDKEDN